MLLQSLRAHCKAPGGAGSIWEYLEEVVRATRVSGRIAYGFRTELHFADACVSNGSNLLQWFWIRVGTTTKLLQCIISHKSATTLVSV